MPPGPGGVKAEILSTFTEASTPVTTPIAPLDFSGVIPTEFSTQIIEEAVQSSAVLQLANLVPMGTGIAEMPVPASLPIAGWVTAPGGRKPYTSLGLELKTLHAEEVAAVTAIPDVYLEDTSINLWAWVRPRIAEAIGRALDNAVLFGTGAPATFPAGGVIAPAFCSNTPAGFDAVDTVNQAMSLVEGQGLPVTGHAADLTVKGVLRGQRSNTGDLLLGTDQVNNTLINTLYGVPIEYSNFAVDPDPNYITGDWSYLIVGVRSDIRYNMDPSAVIADDAGKVVISGWQDNVTPLKVWARFACQIINPVTVRVPDGAKPFSKATLTSWAPPAAEAPAAQSASKGK